MKSIYKWIFFSGNGDQHFDLLGSSIKRLQYSKSRRDGFIVSLKTSSVITARYVERYEFDESVVGPFGEVVEYRQERFRFIDFNIYADPFCIELINPPSGSSPMLLLLSSMCDNKLEVEHKEISVDRWVKEITKCVEGKVVISSAKASDIAIDASSMASLSVKSSSSDVRPKLKLILKRKPYILSRAKFSIASTYAEISNTGYCCIGSLPNPHIGKILREALYRSLSK